MEEYQCGSPLSWGYYFQEEGIEDLKHSLLYTTLELETTILSAHEELARKEEEFVHLKDLLTKTIKERDEAQENCQMLKLDIKVILQQLLLPQQQQCQLDELKGELGSNKGLSSSDSDEIIFAPPPPPPPPSPPQQLVDKLVIKKALPENGKFLQAVMEAGPLLKTLLLAGPLPQWENPPPQLNSTEIPPVNISSPTPRPLNQDTCISTGGCFSHKRALLVDYEASDSSPKHTKYQRVVQQSPPLTNALCTPNNLLANLS